MAGWTEIRQLFDAVPATRRDLRGRQRVVLPLAVIFCLLIVGTIVGLFHEAAAIAVSLPIVLLAAWSCGPRWTMWFALTAAIAPAFATDWHPVEVPVGVVARSGIFLVAGLVVALLRASIDRTTQVAEHDRLTGLLNRGGFLRRLEGEANRAVRSGCPLAVAFIDCDNFKQVNDEHGHHAGDAVLKLTADTIATNIRNYDAAARFGGDEFCVMWPIPNVNSGEEAADRLHRILSDAMTTAGYPVTFSIGVAVFEGIPDAERMLMLADSLMYNAKRNGKGRVCAESFFEPRQIAT